MTVQELINKLGTIKDKNVPVKLVSWSIQNPHAAPGTLVTTNRIVVQAHRVAIITD